MKVIRIAVVGLCAFLILPSCASNETAGELVPEVGSTAAALAPEIQDVDQGLIEAAQLDPCPTGVASPDAAIPGLPQLALNCLDGQSILDLSTARGVPMVVNVWASWCPPCIAEMPLLEQAAEELQGQVQFLGINLQDDREAALQLLADLDVNFASVEDRACCKQLRHPSQSLPAAAPPEAVKQRSKLHKDCNQFR